MVKYLFIAEKINFLMYKRYLSKASKKIYIKEVLTGSSVLDVRKFKQCTLL